jgi:CYTH domain-containing protein
MSAPKAGVEESFLISFSEWRDQQEAMLLMSCGNWVQTDLGRLVLVRNDQVPWQAHLTLEVSD